MHAAMRVIVIRRIIRAANHGWRLSWCPDRTQAVLSHPNTPWLLWVDSDGRCQRHYMGAR